MREIIKHYNTLAKTYKTLRELYNKKANKLDTDFNLE